MLEHLTVGPRRVCQGGELPHGVGAIVNEARIERPTRHSAQLRLLIADMEAHARGIPSTPSHLVRGSYVAAGRAWPTAYAAAARVRRCRAAPFQRAGESLVMTT
jgi:hypothetical protein